MVNRIEIAKNFLHEQLQKRDDVIGSWVGGSVARGEDTESSDIDLGLLVEGDVKGPLGIQRNGIDTWQNGVYIEAALVSKEDYEDIEKVFHDPIKATHMNDALILYDPTGFLARMQKEVQAVFMQPKWVGVRVQHWMEVAKGSYSGLKDAIGAGDQLGICGNAMFLSSLVSVPLLRAGITPSSTRGLVLLGEVSRELKNHICEFEGSSKMSPDDVLALLPYLSEVVPLVAQLGYEQLFQYAIKKIEWMAKNGQHREAFHTMWVGMGSVGKNRECEDPSIKSKGSKLAQSWLGDIGWEGKEVLEEKLKLAKSLLKEVESLAADLPSPESPEDGAGGSGE